MCSRIKSFALGTFLLTAFALLLAGCGNGGGSDTSATKTVAGAVANSTTGQPIANATVTAYAIDAATGAVATTPLATPATTQSDSQGNYSLKLPKNYSGGVMVEATFPSLGNLVAKSGKRVARANSMQRVRSILAAVQETQVELPPVMLTLATEMLVEYLENKGATFKPTDVQTAIIQLEPLLGANFTQVPPLAIGATPTVSQQQLLVVTQLVDSLLNLNTATPPTLAQLVTVDQTSGALGLGTVASLVTVDATTGALTLGTVPNPANITAVTNSVAGDLFNSGLIQGSVATSIGASTSTAATTVVTAPDLTDTVVPAAPTGLTVTATTFNSVALAWTAATDNVAVTEYYIYRDGQYLGNTAAATTTYSDAALAASTTYMYEVKARDAAGNVSAAVMLNAKTDAVAAPAATYAISGTITLSGAPLKGVLVAITGAGSGVAVTDVDGKYSLSGAPEGSYTITPSLSGYAFTPATAPITVPAVTSKNFTATLTGSVTGNGSYANGVVIGGITYPTGIVIGGISYPSATLIGGVTSPTGTVVGGVTYPNGVVIGGVQYPAGTVVGGVAFPSGSIMAGVVYPTGSVIAGIVTPTGTLVGSAALANGSASAALDYYMVVTGRLLNSAGTAPLVGVNAVVVDQGTAAQVTVTSNFDGYYSFAGKIGNTYRVTPDTTVHTFTQPFQDVLVVDGATAIPLSAFTANP